VPTIAAVVNETLRVYPAVTEFPRIATRDTEIGGHAIKAGSQVLPSPFSLHRHPDYWPRPTEWLPARWRPENAAALAPAADRAWLPFSTGPRSCIGRYFSVLAAQVSLAAVLAGVDLGAAPGYSLQTSLRMALGSVGGALVVPRPRRGAGGAGA
jgi:cytochrome P450